MQKSTPVARYDRKEWLRAAAAYMDGCFALATVPRVGEFAAGVGKSREWVTRAFKHAVGESPAAVFRTMQINRAKALLNNTDDPAAKIARDAAFGSERAFYRTFLDRTGLRPRTYRRSRAASTGAHREGR